jgi:GTP-binding protein
VLLHLVEGAGEDAGEAYRTVRHEIEAYGHGLAEKPEIVALSKADALDEGTLKEQLKRLKKACRRTPYVISAASGQGVQEVLGALLSVINEARAEAEPRESQEEWRP